MKIFISWSGQRSKAIATVIKDYLPRVIQALRPWMSHSDIEAGQRWSIEIGDKLQECEVGVCVVTLDNATHPWLNFEAGAISKSVKRGRVIPFLFDVRPSDLAGPLAQFQAKEANKAGCFEMFQALNGLIENDSVVHLEETFNLNWPKLEIALNEIRADKSFNTTNLAPIRSDREVLDEILENLRALHSRPAFSAGTSIVPEFNFGRPLVSTAPGFVSGAIGSALILKADDSNEMSEITSNRNSNRRRKRQKPKGG